MQQANEAGSINAQPEDGHQEPDKDESRIQKVYNSRRLSSQQRRVTTKWYAKKVYAKRFQDSGYDAAAIVVLSFGQHRTTGRGEQGFCPSQ